MLLYNADMVCAMDFDSGFRDTWVCIKFFSCNEWVKVMRTIDGKLVGKMPPDFDISHSGTLERLRQGKPFHVLSAWNGMVSINASVFDKGVRFHDGRSTSCPTSECTLFCLDLWKHNFTRIVVDPQVLVAYDPFDFLKLNKMSFPTARSVIDRDIPYYPMPEEWSCCPILGNNYDGLREDCKTQSLSEWRPFSH